MFYWRAILYYTKDVFFFDVWSGADKRRLGRAETTCNAGSQRGRFGSHSLFLAAGGLLGQEDCLDVGQDTTLSDGDTGEKLVELLIVPHSELKVTGDDPGFLVVSGSVAGQLEDLSSQVLHDGSQVDWCSGTDSLGVVSLAEESVHSTYGELESRTGRSGFGLGSGFASFTTARHVCLSSLSERFDLLKINCKVELIGPIPPEII